MSILTDLQTELQTRTQDVSTLETQLTALDTELTNLQLLYAEALERLRQDIATLDAHIADLMSRIAVVQQAINDLKSQLGII